MIRFQNTGEYALGTCSLMLTDTSTGDILYWDDAFKTDNIEASDSPIELSGGVGDKLLTILSSASRLKLTASSQHFSLAAKGMTVGATPSYNATVMTQQAVTATGTSISIDVSAAAPVAKNGYTDIFCYVTEVGAQNTVAASGTSYPLDATTGAVSNFIAVSGKSYLVWYYIQKATAKGMEVPSTFKPGIYGATAVIPIFRNQTGSGADNKGTLSAYVYYEIPLLRLNPSLKLTGDQTTADTTDLSGTALDANDLIETGENFDCTLGGKYAFISYDPVDETEGIVGLAVVGGEVSLPVSTTAQIPVKYVMEDGTLAQPQYSDLTFVASGAPSGTTVSSTGLITAGSTAGDFTVTITKDALSCIVNISVTA